MRCMLSIAAQKQRNFFQWHWLWSSSLKNEASALSMTRAKRQLMIIAPGNKS